MSFSSLVSGGDGVVAVFLRPSFEDLVDPGSAMTAIRTSHRSPEAAAAVCAASRGTSTGACLLALPGKKCGRGASALMSHSWSRSMSVSPLYDGRRQIRRQCRALIAPVTNLQSLQSAPIDIIKADPSDRGQLRCIHQEVRYYFLD